MTPRDIQSLRGKLVRWYLEHHRKLPWRETNDPYRIWVSEVMLQQTQVKTVLSYYTKFLARFPDVRRLAQADLEEVLKAWEGLGYYARARNLHRAAGLVLERYEGRVPAQYDLFRELPGVGDYIAAAVLSIAFDQRYPAIDGNVKRVLARLFCMDTPVNAPAASKTFNTFAGRLVTAHSPGRFNQAMMELGALICTPQKPDCAMCPLQPLCLSFRQQRVKDYPRRVKREPTPEKHIAVGVVRKNGLLLITRRKNHGLLGGLWEFPGGKVKQNEAAEQACLREIKEEANLTVEIVSHLIRVKHAYTHFRIVMDVFCCRYIAGEVKLSGPVDYQWIMLKEIDRYAFPRANHKFFPILREYLHNKGVDD